MQTAKTGIPAHVVYQKQSPVLKLTSLKFPFLSTDERRQHD